MPTRQETRLDAVFAALADSTRRRLLAQLTDGELTVGELAVRHPMTIQSVSQHLKVLERAGLISRTRVAQTRPCRLEPAALATAVDWIEQARAEWSGRLDRLDAHLETVRGSSRKRR